MTEDIKKRMEKEKAIIASLKELADPAEEIGQFVRTMLWAIRLLQDSENRMELLENVRKLTKKTTVALKKKDKEAIIKIIKNEMESVKKEISGIKKLKGGYSRTIEVLESFVKKCGNGQYFDEKKGFFWKGDDDTNLSRLEELEKAISTLDFINFIKGFQHKLSIGGDKTVLLEHVDKLSKYRAKLLGNADDRYSIAGIKRIRETDKKEIKSPKYAKVMNSYVNAMITSCNAILEHKSGLDGMFTDLIHAKENEVVRLGEELQNIRKAGTLKEGKLEKKDTDRIKVLILTHEYEKGGGVATVVRKLSDHFNKHGRISADIIVKPPAEEIPSKKKYTFYYRGNEPIEFSSLSEILIFMRGREYSLIHIHSLAFCSIFKGGLEQIRSLSPKAKLVYTCHSVVSHERTQQEKYRPWGTLDIIAQKELFEKSDKIIHLTKYGAIIAHGNWKEFEKVADTKKDSYFPEFRNKAAIIPNGIDIKSSFFSLRKNKRIKNAVFGFVGRFAEEKGVIPLSEQLPMIMKKYPDIRFIFIGEDVQGSGIENLMKHNLAEVSDRVEFKGYLTGEKLERAFDEMDILIVPSFNESFSIVSLEAFARKIPVIISEVDGPRELFVDPKSAIGMNPKDPKTIGKSIDFCMENRNLATQKMMRGRDQVKQQFNWDRVSIEYGKLYDCVLAGTAFTSDFGGPDEEVAPLPQQQKREVKIGIIYDIEIWTMFIHPLESKGYEVNVWGEGFHKNTLEEFIRQNDILLCCWVGADKGWQKISEGCRKAGKPLIMKYETGAGMEQDNIKSENLRQALRDATILAPTDLLSSWVLTEIGIPETRQVLLPNGIDVDEIGKTSLNINTNRSRFNLPKDRVIGAFMGRLDVANNVYFVIKAYEKLCEQTSCRDKMMIIRGTLVEADLPPNYMPGRYGSFMSNVIEDSRLLIKKYGGRIILKNSQEEYDGLYGKDTFLLDISKKMDTQAVYWSYLAAIDFYTMPRGWGIGNVRSIAEAMALGKPSLLLDANISPYAYGDAGIYIPTSHKRSSFQGIPLYLPDLEKFTAGLSKLYNDAGLRKKKGNESYKYSHDYMDMGAIAVDRVINVIEWVRESYNPQDNSCDTTKIHRLYKEVASRMGRKGGLLEAHKNKDVSVKEFNERIDIVLPSFNLAENGDLNYFNEATYFILSLAYLYRDDPSFMKYVKVHLCTNEPNYFKFLEPLECLEIHHYTTSKLKELTRSVKDPKYDQTYLYFIKLKMLEDISKNGNSIFLMDSDILFVHDMKKVFLGLKPDISFMNEREWKIGGEMEHYNDFVKAYGNFSIINEDTYMWNSGLVGIHKSNLGVIKDIIELTKSFVATKFKLHEKYLKIYPPEHYGGRAYDNHRTVEQLAVTVVLWRISSLKATWDLYYHYYNYKDKFHDHINKLVGEIRHHDIHQILTDKKFKYMFDWMNDAGKTLGF